MNNLDKLRQLNAKEFWNKIQSLKNGLSEYIDYPAWLDSEDEDLRHFVIYDETVTVYPSEAAMTHFIKESVFKTGRCSAEEQEKYKEEHKKELPVLEHIRIYETDYLIVADLESMIIRKIPKVYTGEADKS